MYSKNKLSLDQYQSLVMCSLFRALFRIFIFIGKQLCHFQQYTTVEKSKFKINLQSYFLLQPTMGTTVNHVGGSGKVPLGKFDYLLSLGKSFGEAKEFWGRRSSPPLVDRTLLFINISLYFSAIMFFSQPSI